MGRPALPFFGAHLVLEGEGGKEGQTINRLIIWVESGAFQPPDHRFPPDAARIVFGFSLIFLGFLLVLLAGGIIYVVRPPFSGIPPLQWAEIVPKILSSSILVLLSSLGVVLTLTVGRWVWRNVGSTVLALLIIAFVPAFVHVLVPDLFHDLINLPQWLKTVLDGLASLWTAGQP